MKTTAIVCLTLLLSSCSRTRTTSPPVPRTNEPAIPAGHYDLSEGIPTNITPLPIPPVHRPLFDAIVRHALRSEETKYAIAAYGEGTKWVLMKSYGSRYEWPTDWTPVVPGYEFRRTIEEIPAGVALGIDLRDYHELRESEDKLFFKYHPGKKEWAVKICIYNAKGISIIGACELYYSFDSERGDFEFCGAFDA